MNERTEQLLYLVSVAALLGALVLDVTCRLRSAPTGARRHGRKHRGHEENRVSRQLPGGGTGPVQEKGHHRLTTGRQPRRAWRLSDGSYLVNPEPRPPNALRLRQWVCLDGQAYRIVNMRQIGVGGRLVELTGHSPVYVSAADTLLVFSGLPAT